MEVKGVEPAGKGIIDRVQRGKTGSIHLVSRQRARRRRISKKQGNVPNVPDVIIIDDGMDVIKMKWVAKMIGVCQDQQDGQSKGEEIERWIFSHLILVVL